MIIYPKKIESKFTVGTEREFIMQYIVVLNVNLRRNDVINSIQDG